MRLDPDALRRVSADTLAHYERAAESFRAGTLGHDVTQNYAALLSAIEGPAPYALLDFGCGPGRDLRYFSSLGHEVTGLDGCATFCEMARASSGCRVLHQDFLALALEPARYDGVFANASLFHVPDQELPRVLRALHETLKPRGVLFSSNPHGNNQEGWSSGRYASYHDLAAWRRRLDDAGFDELSHYYRPEGKPRSEQPWLATVWRRR